MIKVSVDFSASKFFASTILLVLLGSFLPSSSLLAQTVDPEVLAQFDLDDSDTPDFATDGSIYGNNGVISGAQYVTVSGDGSSSSLLFDGVDDSIDLGGLDVNGSGLTLAAWIKADSFPGSARDPRIISKASGIATDRHVFMLSTVRRGTSADTVLRARVRVNGDTATFRASRGVLETGVWYHTAMTFDESTIRLYVDGVEVASTSYPAGEGGPVDMDSNVDVAIGANPNGANFFDGNIDQVVIAQRAFSATEILALADTSPENPDDPPDGNTDNNAPVAVADAYSAEPGAQLTVDVGEGVLNNDSDGDNDPLNAVLVEDVFDGTLDLASDGSFTYTPADGFSGDDSFTYVANDGTEDSFAATVTLAVDGGSVAPEPVTPENNAPIAVADTYRSDSGVQLTVDAAEGVLANDTDADDDLLSAELDDDVTNGTLVLTTDGSFTYTPDTGFTGDDSFSYVANDGTEDSSAVAVTLTVAADESAETIIDVWYGANQDFGNVGRSQVWVNVPGNVSDADGIASLSYTLNGGASQQLSFMPDDRRLSNPGDFNIDAADDLFTDGSNEIVITAVDSLGNASSTTVNVDYSGENVWPENYQIDWSQVDALQDVVEIIDGNWALTEDGIRTVETGYDRLFAIGDENWDEYELVSDFIIHSFDEDEFAGVSVIGPWNGHTDDPISGFQPKAGFNPFGSQSWTAFFPSGGRSQIQSGGYLQPKDRLFTDFDLEQVYNYRYRVEDEQQNGELVYSLKVWEAGTVEPGDWDVQYTDTSSGLVSGSLVFVAHYADVTFGDISVAPVGVQTSTPLVALDDMFELDQDDVITTGEADGVLANDSGGVGALIAVLDTDVVNGSLSLASDGSFTYAPDSGFAGTDSFTYVADDGVATSASATVTLTVDDAPDSDNSDTVVRLRMDDDQDPNVALDSSGQGNNGTIVGAEYAAQTPDGSSRSLDFDFSSVDLGPLDVNGSGITLAAWINADSFPGAGDPRIISKSSGTLANRHVFMLSTASRTNSDGDDEIVLRARVRVNGQTATLRARTGALDTDKWYHAAMTFDETTIRLYLDGVEVDSTSYPEGEGGPVDIDNSIDVAVGANPNGSNYFDGKIDDAIIAQRAFSPAEIQAIVDTGTGGNFVPVANNDSYSVLADAALSIETATGVIANDVDGDGDILTAALLSDTNDGQLQFNADGSFTYTPDSGFVGEDNFSYQLTDGTGTSEIAVVTLSVDLEPNEAPVANEDSYIANADEQLTVNSAVGVLENDSDPDADALTAVLSLSVSNGTLNLDSSGSFTYTPEAGFSGTDAFEYVASDGRADSTPARVVLQVNNAGNQVPVALSDSYNVQQGSTFSRDAETGVLANDTDADGDALSTQLQSDVQNGALTLNDDGSFTYAPSAGFTGGDSFSYTATDGTAASQTVEVTIFIDAAPSTNTAPDAFPDVYAVAVNSSLDVNGSSGVLSNDNDVDINDVLTAVIVDDASDGALSLNSDGSFSYQPDTDFVGQDSFTYIATDGNLNSATVSVEINVQSQASDSDLLARFEFDDFQDPSVATNSGVFDNVGIIDGAQYVTDTADGSLRSLEFDGSNDTVDLGVLDVSQPALTLAAWINADSFPGRARDPRIISKATGTAANDHVFMLSTIRSGSDTLLRGRLRINGTTATVIASSGALATEKWYHAAMVYNGNTLKLFLDGEEVGSRSLSGPIDQASTVSVAVGSQPGGSKVFDGKIDDVRIVQGALTSEEINAIVDVAPESTDTPDAPENVNAQATGASEVNLSWSASQGAAVYDVLRDGELIATVTGTSYQDDTVESGITYTYDIVAVSSSGAESDPTTITVTTSETAPNDWWDTSWNYRLRLTVNSLDTDREDRIAVVPVNLDDFIAAGQGPLDESRVRCVEITSENVVIDETTRCQSGDGELIVLVDGVTPADTNRYYHAYFDVENAGQEDNRTPLVALTTGVLDEGFDALEITTNTGTVYYHTEGGGVSSLIDSDGNDWVSYNTQRGGLGEFRGIPNLVPPSAGGFFHPGFTTSSTTVLDEGPLRIRFESVTNNQQWRGLWDVYPDYVAFTLLEKADDNYWFLYEGTPGGVFDAGDSTVRSIGTDSMSSASDSWRADIPDEEWVIVGSSEGARSLFFSKQNDDTAVDSYRPLNPDGQMTVLGFGRNITEAELTATGESFFFGFLNNGGDFDAAGASIRSTTKEILVDFSGPETRP